MDGIEIFGVRVTLVHVLIAIAAIILLYIARRYARRVIWGFFFGLAHWFGTISRIVMKSAGILHERYSETVVAYRAKQLGRELEALETKVEARIPRYEDDIGKLAVQLDHDAQRLSTAMEQLHETTPSAYAIQAFREGLRDAGADRPQARVNQALRQFKVTFAQEMRKLRAEIISLRTAAPKLVDSAARLKTIQTSMANLAEKANTTFEKFNEAILGDDYARIAAKQSILFPWIAAVLVMAVALSGVFLNFFLIQRPLSEIVGEGFEVFGVGLPVIAAIVVIMLEFIAGIVLFEAAGVTHMIFPDLNPRTKMVLFWVAVIFLVTFSVFEAAIALQRDVLIQMGDELNATAAGETFTRREGMSLSTLAQVLLGIVIPWLLAVAAIPLETVINMGWMIIMLVTHQLLAFFGLLMKMLSSALRSLGAFTLDVYDLIIFLPLAVEKMVKQFNRPEPAPAKIVATSPEGPEGASVTPIRGVRP